MEEAHTLDENTPTRLAKKMVRYFETAGCEGSEYKEALPSFVRFAHRENLTVKALLCLREREEVFRVGGKKIVLASCNRKRKTRFHYSFGSFTVIDREKASAPPSSSLSE